MERRELAIFPAVPGGAFDRFVGDAERASRTQRTWTPDDGPLPALYVSHGAPPLFDDGAVDGPAVPVGAGDAEAAEHPHRERALGVGAADAVGVGRRTPLVYDFGGFHPRYYAMTYPTPDAGDLARQVRAPLPDREPVHEHPSRGLDHGAWVPLKVMYPLADVPVLQLSLPTQDPGRLLEIGQRLRPLREDGVLVIGSGFMTHGLPFMTREMVVDGAVPSWSADFDAWAADALSRGDVETLSRYQSLAPGLPYAHPTVDHYIPLFITLGRRSDPTRP